MARIMTRCPRHGMPVWTGLTTRSVIFTSLPNVAVPLQCDVCGHVHRWRPRQAWLHEEPDPADPAARAPVVLDGGREDAPVPFSLPG
jgi:hypothetical protein